MIVTIKPHSVFAPYFNSLELKADLKCYYDLWYYISALHPKFLHYIQVQKQNGLQEGFALLDKDLKEINPEDLKIRHCKEGDVIYIVPAIIGEGGKRGILALLAVVAFFLVLPSIAATGALGLNAATTSAVGKALGASAFQTSFQIIKSNVFLKNILINVGLSLVARLFSPRPKAGEQSRQNDLFGSLTNTTSSGTPIALHYGQVRVAGQFISGFILTIPHSKGETATTDRKLIPQEAKS